jgi:Zn-dependent alcohol dehydrogenase
MSPSKPGTPHGMRAVVAYAPEDFRLEEIEVPTPCPGEILVHEALDLCHRRDPLDQGGHTTMTGPLEAGRR